MPLFESGAILFYLAEKTGLFLPGRAERRYQVMQWLMFQMGGIGPMFGQNSHFRVYTREPIPYAIERYSNEVQRLFRVVDQQLAGREYLAGEYSIADIATFPWLARHERQGVSLEPFPEVAAYLQRIGARPAVKRGLAVLADRQRVGPVTDEIRRNMFGTNPHAQR